MPVFFNACGENGENQLKQGIQKAAGCKINFRHGSRQDAFETDIVMFSICRIYMKALMI